MTTWDKMTARSGWALLVVFTALSAYLNARRVMFDEVASTERIVFHASIPEVLLIAGLFAELVALSGVHRAAKWVTVTVLTSIFAVTLIASYIAVLAVVQRWNPHAPGWVNQGLAAVPDAAMVMAGTVVLSLRMRRHGLAPATPRATTRSPWRRVADAAAARAEAALAVPGEGQAAGTDTSVESGPVYRGGASPARDTHTEAARGTPRARLAIVHRGADPRRIAEQLVADGRTTASVETVTEVLQLLADGVPQRVAAERAGLSVGAVQRIAKAAREAAA